MGVPLNILMVEDSEDDAALLLRELRRGGYDPTSWRVDTPEAMHEALDKLRWDVIVADYAMPRFSGPAALALLKETGKDIPYITVSGTVGEEIAVDMMRAGAHDYMMKDKLMRLVPAIKRELHEAEMRRDHRRAEEALRESQTGLAKAQEIAHLGNWDWDIVTNELRWSDEIYRIFGLQPQEFGATYDAFLDLVHSDDRDRVRESVYDALYRSQPYGLDHRILLPDGEVRVVHEDGEVTLDETGKPTRMVGTVQDITERKHTEEELRLAKEAAEAANTAKDEFLAKMSHELRTPLNAVVGFSEGLLDRVSLNPLNEHQVDRITRILESGRHLLGLINQLLDVARIDAGRTELNVTTFQLRPLAEEVAHVAESLVSNEPYLDFSLELDDDIPPLTSDREKIQEILLNLVSNAVKFTSCGSVDLRIQCDSGRVLMIVADTGIGIPEDQMEQIFGSFNQVNGASAGRSPNPSVSGFRASSMRGTGLGLSISRSLAEMLGGELTAESIEGRGSTFTLILPLSFTSSGIADSTTEAQTDDRTHVGVGRTH